ncbi:glutathione transferase GST 23-like [Rosa rugosa]|uniref:glutathione transferase GST 23-like n=1 Tax=Rosa rugosa TaxID=74645 RepID=UPI002B403F43|nr:glutathione transferase GST 23-like [Rosa rugosa]
MWDFFIKVGEEQEKATKTCLEILKTIEEHGLCGGDAIGLADLILGWVIHILLPMETITGIKLIEAETFPSLHLWLENFSESPAIKENLPDMDRVMEFFKKTRESFIK